MKGDFNIEKEEKGRVQKLTVAIRHTAKKEMVE